MPSIIDIRSFMHGWKQMTYLQGLDYCYAIKKDTNAYAMTKNVLELQNLSNKVMDGYSVQGIPIKNEGKVDIIFTDVFWKLAVGYITPVNYVGSIVVKCMSNKIHDIDQIAGIVGRGLRAFPSFLREMDLTYKLSVHFPNAQLVNSAYQDVNDHTDIYIKNQTYEYRIWSYQNFDRGLQNTAARLLQHRGNIPTGIHVLCPIDIANEKESEEVDGWFFYSDRYVNYIYEMIMLETPDRYSAISRMGEYAVMQYIRKANTIIK